MTSDHAGHDPPDDHADRMARARLSLEGLSVGDSFGEWFFSAGAVAAIAARTLPPEPWYFTDDTMMALSIVETLDHCGRIDSDDLAERFARRYREQPGRGYGGTARIILGQIGGGGTWQEASGGAFDGEGSMGNGGAMRVGPAGGYFGDDFGAAADAARASAQVTHAHADGQAGAIAVAVAAARAWQIGCSGDANSGPTLLESAIEHTPEGMTRAGLLKALRLPGETSVQEAVAVLGNGSRIVSYDTVPFSLWCAARHLNSYEEAIWTTVSGLGDRDTTCAIVGSIVALAVGREGIPEAWIKAREPLGA